MEGQHGKKFDYKKILKETLLWLFIINLGIAVGAGFYEYRVVVPTWEGSSPQTWPNTGLLFWVYVTTMPLTLLTIANAFVAWKTPGPRRKWYIAAVAIRQGTPCEVPPLEPLELQ